MDVPVDEISLKKTGEIRTPLTNPSTKPGLTAEECDIYFENYTGRWLESKKAKPVLDSVNIKVKKNSLSIIIGSIGSGKSSLIMSLLNEMPFSDGRAEIKGRVAYVE